MSGSESIATPLRPYRTMIGSGSSCSRLAGGILLLYIACQIISAMMPFLAVGAVGWFALKVFGKCR